MFVTVIPRYPVRRVIISAELATNSMRENEAVTAELQDILTNTLKLEHFQAEGCYDGHKEVSFVVDASEDFQATTLAKLAAEFGQESVLEVSELGTATLHYTDGSNRQPQALGKFLELEQNVIINEANAPAYTKIGNRYFVTTGD